MRISAQLPNSSLSYGDLLVLATISVAFYASVRPFFGWDQAWYALHGLSIFNGQGYVGPETGALLPSRGPLYPLMIAGTYFCGIDSRHAFWTAKFFAVVAPLIVYWAGHLTGGRFAARIASALYMTSIAANFSITRPIDNIWSVLALAAVCVFLQALKKDSLVQALVSGAIFGLAYLTKEAAVLIFPMPFLLWLGEDQHRTKSRFRLVLCSTTVAMGFALAWLLYVRQFTSETKALGVQGGIVLDYIFNKIFLIIASPKVILDMLANMFVTPLSWLGLGLPLALLAGIALSWRHPAIRPVIAWSCCIAPLMIYIAMRNWDAGYYTPMYMMSFVAIGVISRIIYEWFVDHDKIMAAKAVVSLLVIYGVLLISTPSLGNNKRVSRLSLNPLIPSEMLPSKVSRVKLQNWFDDKNSIAIAGALELLKIDQAVVMPDIVAYSLAFISKGAFRPTLFSPAVCFGEFRAQTRYIGDISCAETPFLFFLTKRANFDYYTISFSSQERLFSTLREYGPYLVVSGRKYVDSFGYVDCVRRIAGTPEWGIYKVESLNMTTHDRLFIDHKESKKNWVSLQQEGGNSMQNVIDQARKCLGNCVDQDVIGAWIEMVESQRNEDSE
jgi:hypothetical protein